MITHEQREAISDEFQSTFAQPSPSVLQNLFYPHERERVEAIIRKHVPGVGEIRFHRLFGDGDEYSMWAVAVLPAPVSASEGGKDG